MKQREFTTISMVSMSRFVSAADGNNTKDSRKKKTKLQRLIGQPGHFCAYSLWYQRMQKAAFCYCSSLARDDINVLEDRSTVDFRIIRYGGIVVR